MLTKNAIGNLINRYKAVLKKCNLINTFGSLCIAASLTSAFVVGSAGFAEAFDQARSESAYEVTSGVTEGDPNYYTTFTIQENGVDTTYGVKFKGNGAPVSLGATESIQALVRDYLVNKIKLEQGTAHGYTITPAGPNAFNLLFDGKTVKVSESPTTGEVIVDLQGNSTDNRNTSSPNNIYENFIGNTGLLDGGAVFNNNVHDIDTIEGDFIKNSVVNEYGKGGAIYNIEGATISTITGDFISNSATSGGAIYTALEAILRYIDGDFIANEASYGGAIYTDGASINDIVGDFLANTARLHGGAIYSSNSEITSIEGDFIGNSAQLGGAIYNIADNQTNSIITKLTADFMNNIAAEGGAIYNDSQIETIRADFIGNKAFSYGGAIYNLGNIDSITGNFFNNSADEKGGAIYTTKSLNFSANASSRFISGNYTDSGVIKDYNAIYVDGAGINLNFNLDDTGSYTLNDNVRGNGVDKYTVNITSGGVGFNTFNLNNALHGVGLVTVNNATMTLGSTTYGRGVIENARFEQTGGYVQVDDKAVLQLTGGFIAGEPPSGGVLSIKSGGSLIITSGTFTVDGDSTLIVDAGAAEFAVEENGELLFGLNNFGYINQDGTYSVSTSIKKTLDNDGNLALIVDFSTMDYIDYNNFLADFKANEMIGSGTVELKDVAITTTDTYLKNILDGASLPNNVVLGADVVDPDGGTFAAGRTAVIGGVNGDVTNNGTLTLTGEGDAAGMLVDGNLRNNNTINLGVGTISGDVFNTGIVNIAGNLTVNTITSSKGASVDAINVKNDVLLTVDTFNSDYNTTITVGEDADGVGATLSATGEVRFADSTVYSFNKWQGTDDIREASASIYNKIFESAITSRFIVAQNSYALFGEGNRDNVEGIFSESQYTWGSDVTAAIFFTNPHRLGDDAIGGSIIVDGSAININAANINSAVFAADSLFVVDAKGIGNKAALTATNGKLTVDADAKLYVTGAVSGDTIAIVEGFKDAGSSIAAGGWDGDNLSSSTTLQTIKVADFDPSIGSYVVQVTASSKDDIVKDFPAAQGSSAKILEELAKVFDVDSEQESLRFFSVLFSDTKGIGKNNPTEAIKIMESILQLAQASAASGMSMGASYTAANNIIAHLSRAGFNLSSTGGQGPAVVQVSEVLQGGVAAGSESPENGIKNGMALWLSPMYKYSTVQGIEVGVFENGYKSSLGGLSVGGDYTIDNTYRIGLAFNLGTGYAQSTGDLSETYNSFDFWGLSLYGAYYRENFSLMADVGFSSVSGQFNQDVPSILGTTSVEAYTKSTTWTAGLTAEYTFNTSFMDITPHAGVRYMHVQTGAYDTEDNLGVVSSTEADSQSLWYFPVGVTFSKDFVGDNGWTFKPRVDLGVIFAAGDLHTTSVSSIPGVAGSAEYSMQNVDGFAFSGGVGFDVINDNGLSLGLNYNLQASEHETGHMLNAVIRYEF